MTKQQGSRDRLGAFDDAAADFSALAEYLWGPIGRATVAAVAPRPGERVLDACCGTGASAVPAAEAVGADGRVDAVDVSEPMVDQLRRHAADVPQLRAHCADVLSWQGGDDNGAGYDGAGYDVVVSALGIFFLPDMTAGTDRLIGMARPGGRVAFTIWREHAIVPAGKHLAGAIAAATDTAPSAPRERHLIDEINRAEPFADWLVGRGLSDVDVEEHAESLRMTPDLAWLLVLGSGFRGMVANLAPDVVADVRERYLSSLAESGLTELDVTTLIGTGTRR